MAASPGAQASSGLGDQERLRLVLEATRAGIWDFDVRSGVTYASARFDEIIGSPAGEGPRSLRGFLQRVVPDDRPRVLELMRDSLRSGQPCVIECRIHAAHGEVRWLHVRGEVLLNKAGRATRIVGALVDSTTEASARIRRDEQDRFFAGLNAALPLIVYVFDTSNNQLLFTNRSFGDLIDQPDAAWRALIDAGLHTFIHPDDVARIPEIHARIAALADGEVDVTTLRAKHRDGSWRWLSARSTPLRRHPDGSLWHIVGTAEDFTEQVLASERLRDQERELARAQAIAQVGSWTWSALTQQISCSAELYRILDLIPHSVPVTESLFESMVPPADFTRLRSAHEACLRHGTPVDMRFRIRRKGGALRYVHSLAEARRDDDGTLTAIVGTLQDVTDDVAREDERQRLEAKVHHAQKLESLGLLAGGIAHDFNNLLVGVLSNASLALLDLEPDSPVRDVVLEIENTAQRAAELTRQLLAYSGKGRFVVEPLNLSALTAEMSHLLRTTVSKDVTLQFELPDSVPAIRGDASQLRQVIINLITNASDALSGKPGSITVRTCHCAAKPTDPDALQFGELAPNSESVCLEIRDFGCGMSRETAERIFDPFFTTKFTGRGLGLAATLGIVRGHAGRITVETGVGEGTRFLLEFPVARVPPRSPREVPEAGASTAAGRVLVVDDDRVVRGVCVALLTRRGYTVESVESGVEALDRLASVTEPFRFVMLDLTMPGLSGIEVLREIRDRERADGTEPVTVFLMSGYSEQDVARGLGDLTIAGFLEKPFTINDLDVLLSIVAPA